MSPDVNLPIWANPVGGQSKDFDADLQGEAANSTAALPELDQPTVSVDTVEGEAATGEQVEAAKDGRLRRFGRNTAITLGVAAMPIDYAVGDIGYFKTLSELQSHFGHTTGTALAGLALWAYSFGGGLVGSRIPRAGEAAAKDSVPSKYKIVRLGQLAAAGVKLPFEKLGTSMQHKGEKLEKRKSSVAKAIGHELIESGFVNATGTPVAGYMRAKKLPAGEKLPYKVIAKDATRLTMPLAFGAYVSIGANKALNWVGEKTGHPALASRARLPLHWLATGFNYLTDVHTMPGEITVSTAAVLVGAVALKHAIKADRSPVRPVSQVEANDDEAVADMLPSTQAI